jgi:hypothetical protein
MQSLKQIHLESLLISFWWLINDENEWELRLARMSSMSKCQEGCLGAVHNVFINPKMKRVVRVTKGYCPSWPDAASASGRSRLAAPMLATCPHSNIVHLISTVEKQSASSQPSDRTWPSKWSDSCKRCVRSSAERFPGRFSLIRRVRSQVTWLRLASGRHSISLCTRVKLMSPFVRDDQTRALRVRSRDVSCVSLCHRAPPTLLSLIGRARGESFHPGARVRSLLTPPFIFSKSATASPSLPIY